MPRALLLNRSRCFAFAVLTCIIGGCSGGGGSSSTEESSNDTELQAAYEKFEDGQISEEQLTEQAKALDQ